MKNLGENGAWEYPGRAGAVQIFAVPPISSGMGKFGRYIRFKFCAHIYGIDRNESPLKFRQK